MLSLFLAVSSDTKLNNKVYFINNLILIKGESTLKVSSV